MHTSIRHEWAVLIIVNQKDFKEMQDSSLLTLNNTICHQPHTPSFLPKLSVHTLAFNGTMQRASIELKTLFGQGGERGK